MHRSHGGVVQSEPPPISLLFSPHYGSQQVALPVHVDGGLSGIGIFGSNSGLPKGLSVVVVTCNDAKQP